ncbi:GNAT family N-acetyltransferase [Streptomyces spiramenti]|uniref:GNAT family N-acetyltransferase n=1 Tax=Streptomyces spiramenti TaxID=2720606 RepID=A0ABX1ALS7_9ACTN|nr:GNAT family protein [Streptomyces spiramenti]NJP65337.1 GNAT family N-acetyltransferase [Streptomyces spiramenti]
MVNKPPNRLRLREVRRDDIEALHAIYGDAATTQHLSFEPRTPEQVASIIDRSMASAVESPRTEHCVAFTLASSDELVGFGRLARDPHQMRAATVGFAIHRSLWGQGLGVESLTLLLGLGFDELNLHRVWGARSPLNAASKRTMEAVNMTQEGVIREHVLKNGSWRDSVVHAILDREWHQGTPNAGT